MRQFDYVIFSNNAPEPLAGFAFKDDAIAWIRRLRWGNGWCIEIRQPNKQPAVAPMRFIAKRDGSLIEQPAAALAGEVREGGGEK